MSQPETPLALVALDAPLKTPSSFFPEPFFSRMDGRQKRPLGDLFGLTNFGVNLTRIVPGDISALRHSHSKQDEFLFVDASKEEARVRGLLHFSHIVS